MVGRISCQSGGMTVYEGSRRQRGGNLFSTIKRMIIPLGKKAAPILQKTGKDLLKRGLEMGVGTIKDRLANKSTTLSDSFKKQASKAVESAAHDYFGVDAPDVPFTSQDGAGRKRKRRKKATPKKAPAAKRRKAAPKSINKAGKQTKETFNDIFD